MGFLFKISVLSLIVPCDHRQQPPLQVKRGVREFLFNLFFREGEGITLQGYFEKIREEGGGGVDPLVDWSL